MSDEVANKIIKLDKTASELVNLTKIIGIICIVDLILPDPILGLDEITLVVITSIIGSVATIMNNKIQDLVVEGRAKLELSRRPNQNRQTVSKLGRTLQNQGKVRSRGV